MRQGFQQGAVLLTVVAISVEKVGFIVVRKKLMNVVVVDLISGD